MSEIKTPDTSSISEAITAAHRIIEHKSDHSLHVLVVTLEFLRLVSYLESRDLLESSISMYAKPQFETTRPKSDSLTDEQWFAEEKRRIAYIESQRTPRLIDILHRKWWFVNLVYNKLRLYRLMRYLFGDSGALSKDRRTEREYATGGDKVVDE